MSHRPAIVGSKPEKIPLSNVYDWVFSNPLRENSEVMTYMLSEEDKQRSVPLIPTEKPYLVDAKLGLSLSFQKARQDALHVAAGLQRIHRQISTRGDEVGNPVVLLHLPNCVQFAPLLLGIFAAGFTATMANAALTATEIEWILSSAEPMVVVTTLNGWKALQDAILSLKNPNLKNVLLSENRIFLVNPSYPAYTGSKKESTPQGTQPWDVLLQQEPLQRSVLLNENQCHSQTALILWSSGTSGKSKGVQLSHSAMISTMISVWFANKKYDHQQRWLGFAPFFHTFGLLNVLLLAPCCGATIFVMQQFDPQQMVTLIQQQQITYLHMAPPVGLLLAKSPLLDGVDMGTVQRALSGGAPLGGEVIEAAYKRLGILILMGYGLSETGGVCGQIAKNWEELRVQLGSCGQPMYGVELKVVSTDDSNQVLSIGESGEILIRSPSNMLGYLNNKEATDESLDKDGWFHSGDVGFIDKEGRLFVTDRLKEVIKVKGFQVSPADLEGILCSSDFITDAGVTSVYDSEEGTEYPRAYIVPTSPHLLAQCIPRDNGEIPKDIQTLAGQVKSWMEERTINYKWLRGNLVFTRQIPKSPSGKILRRLLKDIKGVEVNIYDKKTRAKSAKL